jgi:hypothetical protein
METRHKIHYRLWLFIIAALCFPLFQGITKIITIKNLGGAVTLKSKPVWSADNWFSGHFQDEALPYLNEQIGFYPDFIRINNEVQYRLADIVNAKGVVVGKDHYLYEKNYIKAYTGTDFIGEEQVKEKVALFQQFSDSVSLLGKQVLVILAPGKASYFPEFIPDGMDTITKLNANYEGYKAELKESTVPFIDAHQWFRSMKDTSRYPLFPKCGIHWSKYGQYLMLDSLSKYLNTINPGSAPRVVLDEVTWSNKNLYSDYDLGKGMNMLSQSPVFPMAYPKFHFELPLNSKKKAIVVADSYYWGLHSASISSTFFEEGEFWYYNKEIHYTNGKRKQFIDATTQVSDEIKDVDLFIFLSTDANLYKFPFDFFKKLSQAKDLQLIRVIEKNIKRIKEDPKWLKFVAEKAKKKEISLEEAIYLDARYLALKNS